MRRVLWLCLGLGLAALMPTLAARPAAAAEKTKPEALGTGPAYRTLGELAVMSGGRTKPIDTVARQVVKQVYSRETIQLPASDDQPATRWSPVAALFDWTFRPDFWDHQPFILVEYLPLKRLMLAEPIQKQLSAIAGKDATPGEVRAAIERLIEAKVPFTAAALRELAQMPGLADEDRRTILGWADRLGESGKWLSPREIETAVVTLDGHALPFVAWIDDITSRAREISRRGGEPKDNLSSLEQKAFEVASALTLYQAMRDRRPTSGLAMAAVPRPANEAYLTYTAEAFETAMEQRGSGLSLLQMDVADLFFEYIQDVPRRDRSLLGEKPEFDAQFTAFLKENAGWAPLWVILNTDAQELQRAGFPSQQTEAFRAAFRDLEDAAIAQPGRLDPARAEAFVASARALGESLGHYPSPQTLARESHFNRFAPFFRAPAAYGAGALLLILSLVFAGVSTGRDTALGMLGRASYLGGMLGLVGGIALEVYGFYLRVMISGWAPVTNMYETVVWVGLVTAVIGLVMELIYRKTYVALAASGVAFLATLIAANVPLLDPNIPTLEPVLRSNLWLTVHVLTIVSSYAAFALAMGLGLIASVKYLTATYKRDVGYGELASLLVPGVPLLALGVVGVSASQQSWEPGWLSAENLFYAAYAVALVGGFLTIMALTGLAGEAIARATFRSGRASGPSGPSGFNGNGHGDGDGATPAATSVQTVTVNEGQGATSTLTKPSIAELVAKAAAPPELDARTAAMQATAARIKPLSNFTYRAMQVGVLLLAAGTILGGVWADYSWGRFWGWDPKEVWALIALLVYLVPLHGRFAGWVNTFGLTVFAVACFSSVLMAWYGVNFVLGVGLHSYGFTEGGGQWTVVAITAAVLAFVFGAVWRRGLARRGTAASQAEA